MPNEFIDHNHSNKMFTQGADLRIHNNTPFEFQRVDHYLYQMECDFPNSIQPYSIYNLRVEFGVTFLIESDDEGYGVYSLKTSGGEKRISLRYDKKMNSKFNMWVDLCESKGNLHVKSGEARKNLGFSVNGTFDFFLFYNEDTREFALEPFGPIPRDAIMKIGYYTLDIGFFEHTYAIMTENNKTTNVNFHCSGGIEGVNNVRQADFYNQATLAKTGETSYACNKAVARILASWDPVIDWNRINYNRSKKWQLQGSDNAGLVYAITGVCHQMCNTVLCSINPEDIFSTPINKPESYSISRMIYGTFGTGMNRIPKLKNMIKEGYVYYLISTEENRQRLLTAFKEANEAFIADLKIQLSGANLAQQRLSIIREVMDTHVLDTLPEDTLDELISFDLDCALRKNKLDIMLIKGEIKPQTYAEDVNNQIDELAAMYAKYNLITTNKAHHNLIDPTFIPDYSELRKILFK